MSFTQIKPQVKFWLVALWSLWNNLQCVPVLNFRPRSDFSQSPRQFACTVAVVVATETRISWSEPNKKFRVWLVSENENGFVRVAVTKYLVAKHTPQRVVPPLLRYYFFVCVRAPKPVCRVENRTAKKAFFGSARANLSFNLSRRPPPGGVFASARGPLWRKMQIAMETQIKF